MMSFALHQRQGIMSQKPVTMEKLKQVLQLNKDGIPIREIVRRTGISRNAIKRYLLRMKPQPGEFAQELSNKQLAEKAYDNEALLFTTDRLDALIKHFIYAEKELHKTGVNKQLLWMEYKDQHPHGYGYSRYCYHFKVYLKRQDIYMHQQYEAGDMIMADFAGKKLHYTHPDTGEKVNVEVFVGILPYSGMIFCKAVHTQRTADFVGCINAMLIFYGAVPKTVLCDNLKTAVKRSCKYEPVFTEMCNQLSEHYQTTFSATRPYSPRDKAMVESAVRIVYTNIYAPLRHTDFFSLEEIQYAIQGLLAGLSNKPYKNTAYSRLYYYEQYEMATLKCLPQETFILKKFVQLTVQRNYHIQLSEDHKYFSVHHSYVGKKVKVLYDNKTVEIYHDYVRIAVHPRTSISKAYTTLSEHMPPNHLHMHQTKGWSKQGMLLQAAAIGPYTRQAVEHMLDNSIYMVQNYKACFGMMMLEKKYTKLRLEEACRRAATGPRINYTMIKNILQKGLDKQNLLFDNIPLPDHENIRGSQNYT
jgi:transposase